MTEALAQGPVDRSYRIGIVLCMTAGALWSMVGIVIRLIEEASAWQILFYRSVFLCLTLLAVIALRRRGDLRGAFAEAGWGSVVAALCLVVAFAGSIFSLVHTTVANAMFLFASAPFLAAGLGLLILGESVRRATWVAMTLAMAGVGIMVAGGLAADRVLGNAAALLSALGFAGFTVALRWNKAKDLLPALCLGGFFAAIVAGAACLTTGEGFAVPLRDLGLTACLGVVQLGLGMAIYTAGARRLPAAELALLAMTEVLLGPIWPWLFLGEVPSESTLMGGALVVLAICGNAVSGLRRRRPPVLP